MKRILNAAVALALVGALSILATHNAMAQQKGTSAAKRGAQFVDQDGDGVCDNFATKGGQKMGQAGARKGNGTCDGTGHSGQGPKDGTGYGKMNGGGMGTGACDGTGPKGKQSRGK